MKLSTDPYDIGKTKATEFVQSAEFPNTVVPGMHRYPLRALEAWELAFTLVGTVAEEKLSVAPAPVMVTPPAPGRPGRRSTADRKVA